MSKKRTDAPAEQAAGGLTLEQRRERLNRDEFSREVMTHLRSGTQIIGIDTPEEHRVEVVLKDLTRELRNSGGSGEPFSFVTWDLADGFVGDGVAPDMTGQKMQNPITALTALAQGVSMTKLPRRALIVMRDLDDWFNDARVRRLVRTISEGARAVNQEVTRPIVMIGPNLTPHPRVRTNIAMVEFKLPNAEYMDFVLDIVLAAVARSNPDRAVVSPEMRERIVAGVLGLTAAEAEQTLSRGAVQHGTLNVPEVLRTIKEEKAAIIKKSEVLSVISEDLQADRNEIGGYELFLTWLERRRHAYRADARDAKIDYPKGVVLVGPPGTGKSMVAAAAAKQLGLPALRLDVGAVFGSLVGESESRMRAALRQVEAQRGCVLLVDEIDKALGGAHSSKGDSGVTQRVFGQFLSWLADKRDPTFVIATMNRTEAMAPETLRAGRFDAVFATDLPTTEERRQIFNIHLAKRGVAPTALDMSADDWEALLELTADFVGSEVEQMVVEARHISWSERNTGLPSFDDLHQAAQQITPLSRIDPEGLQAMRRYCADARPVSAATARQPGPGARRVDIDTDTL